jgi:hypothetical protein
VRETGKEGKREGRGKHDAEKGDRCRAKRVCVKTERSTCRPKLRSLSLALVEANTDDEEEEEEEETVVPSNVSAAFSCCNCCCCCSSSSSSSSLSSDDEESISTNRLNPLLPSFLQQGSMFAAPSFC